MAWLLRNTFPGYDIERLEARRISIRLVLRRDASLRKRVPRRAIIFEADSKKEQAGACS